MEFASSCCLYSSQGVPLPCSNHFSNSQLSKLQGHALVEGTRHWRDPNTTQMPNISPGMLCPHSVHQFGMLGRMASSGVPSVTFFLITTFLQTHSRGGFANPWLIFKVPTFPSVVEGSSSLLWLSAKHAEKGEELVGREVAAGDQKDYFFPCVTQLVRAAL